MITYLTLTAPCATCPFRADRRFGLTRARCQEIAASLAAGRAFTCHKTLSYEPGEQPGQDPKHRHCAGALLVLKSEGLIWENPAHRLAASFGAFDPERLQSPAFPVFESFKDFIEGASQ